MLFLVDTAFCVCSRNQMTNNIFFLLEPQTLHILYIIHTNLAKLIRTEKKHLMACSSFEHKTWRKKKALLHEPP